MYSSPIEKIYSEIQTQMVQEDENMVMKAIREVGITVDKEELINALQYDRKQYTKGYEDGKNEVLDKIRAEIETKYGQCDICEYFEDYDYDENDISEYRPIGNIVDILQIIDKYKSESEDKE